MEKVYFEDSSTILNFGVKAMIRAERSPEIKVWLIDTLRNADTFVPEDAKAKNLKPRKGCHATAVKTPCFQVISPLQMAQGLVWHFVDIMDPFALKTYVLSRLVAHCGTSPKDSTALYRQAKCLKQQYDQGKLTDKPTGMWEPYTYHKQWRRRIQHDDNKHQHQLFLHNLKTKTAIFMDNETHTQPQTNHPIITEPEEIQHLQKLPLINTTTSKTPSVRMYSEPVGDIWMTPEEAKDLEAINFNPWGHIPQAMDTKDIRIVRTHRSRATQPRLRLSRFYDPGEVDIQRQRPPPEPPPEPLPKSSPDSPSETLPETSHKPLLKLKRPKRRKQQTHQTPPVLKKPILKNTYLDIKTKAFSDSLSKMAPTKRQNYKICLIKSGEDNEVWTEDYQD